MSKYLIEMWVMFKNTLELLVKPPLVIILMIIISVIIGCIIIAILNINVDKKSRIWHPLQNEEKQKTK